MRLPFIALLVIAPLSIASVSSAGAADCTDMPQMDMNICADQSFQKADEELNALYNTIKARLAGDPETTSLLVAAERAWVSFRDAECKLASSGVSGGSIYPTIYAQCLEQLTNARVETFKAYLTCEEGDLSCPVPAQ